MFAPQFFVAATFIGAKGDYGRHAAQTTDGGLQSAASPATCPSPVPIAPRRKSHCNCLFLYILANRLEKIALFLVSSAWVGDPRACKGAQSSHQRLWGLQDARLSRSMFFYIKAYFRRGPSSTGLGSRPSPSPQNAHPDEFKLPVLNSHHVDSRFELVDALRVSAELYLSNVWEKGAEATAVLGDLSALSSYAGCESIGRPVAFGVEEIQAISRP